MLFQTMMQGTGLAMLEVSVKALAPVFVGDAVCGIVKIENIKQTSKEGRAVVRYKVDVEPTR